MTRRAHTESPPHVHLALIWRNTLLEDRWLPPGTSATVGSDERCTFTLPETAGVSGTHTLVVDDGAGPRLIPPTGARGTVIPQGATASHGRPLAGPVELDGDARGVMTLGEFTLAFRCDVGPDRRQLPRIAPWHHWDTGLIAGLLVALLGQMAFLVAAFHFWEPRTELTQLDLSDRFIMVEMKLIPEEPERPSPPEEAGPEDEGTSKAIEGPEGAAGEPERPDERPTEFARDESKLVKDIRRQGVLQALDNSVMGRGPLTGVFGGREALAEKLDVGLSGIGEVTHMGRGNDGLGYRGLHGGGGGSGFGQLQGVGTIPGRGRGHRPKGGLGRKPPKRKKLTVDRLPPRVGDYCKPSDIMRVVERRQRGLKFCYEKGLRASPELSGKVTFSWRIGLDGKVMKVLLEEDGLRDAAVVGCMKRNIARWRFPKPDEGVCQVNFPFVFNAGL